MLSDEEKKGYEEAKLYLTHTGVDDFNLEKHQSENRIWAIETLLNLIEKQSKEIEELKEKVQKYEKQIDLEFAENEIKKAYLDGLNSAEKNYINKIKAKIEEVEQWELYNMKIPKLSTLDERLGAKIGIKYVLQSLLEKE